MAKDLVLDVIARRNSKELSALADEFDALAKKTDASGKKTQEHATFSKFLEDQLKLTKQQVRELGLEFERTGDKDVFAKLRGAQANLGKLEGIQKQLKSSMSQYGTEAGEEAGLSIGKALMASGPAVIPAAALLGTEILAAVGGGTLAVAGGGALATGIMMQLKSPGVRSSVDDLGHYIMGALGAASSSFQDPLLAGIDELKQGLSGPLSELGGAFKEIAPYVEVFGRELGHAAQVFMPMFTSALKDAGPVLGVVAHELPTLARGLGDFFQQIGHGAKGGAEALDTFIKAFSLGLSGLGYLIRGAENTFDGFVQVLDRVTGFADKAAQVFSAILPRAVPVLGGLHDYVHGVATSFDDGKISGAAFAGTVAGDNDSVLKAMQEATKAADDLSGAMDKLIGKNLSADQAAVQQKQSVDDLKQSILDNGRAWDINTEAGRKNQNALLAAIQAAEQKRQADVANGKDARQAALDYNAEVEELLGIAGRAGDAKTALDALKGKYEVDVQTVYLTQFISEGTPPSQFFHGLAEGGPVVAGKPYIVGEEGPELFVSKDNGYIVPADQTAALMGGGRYGASTSLGGATTLVVSAADPQAAWLLSQLRIQVAAKGGNVQRVLGQGA